jgi:hypothetical protein
MKRFLMAVVFAFAGHAVAGEDSTYRWGAGGTGPAWYQTECSLSEFFAAQPLLDAPRPSCMRRDSRAQRVTEERTAPSKTASMPKRAPR